MARDATRRGSAGMARPGRAPKPALTPGMTRSGGPDAAQPATTKPATVTVPVGVDRGVTGDDAAGRRRVGTIDRILASFRPHVDVRDEATGLSRAVPLDRVRTMVAWAWRLYALIALVTVWSSLERNIGPGREPAFGRFHAADFGGFYTGATIAHRGNYENLGNRQVQQATQQGIQQAEGTGWRWFNPLPHPPILSLATSPIARLPIRTAYWVWVAATIVAAGMAAYLLGRAMTPAVPLATTAVLVTFEPLWHLIWWGQVDAFILLPFAAGCALLVRSRSRDDDILAGAMMGVIALTPQYAIVPFLALALGRRWAAAGMAASAGALALGSALLVGRTGVDHYLDMARYFGAFSGTATVTEWAMFNIRGVLLRQYPGLTPDTGRMLVYGVSIGLGALAVAAAARALRPGRAPDLALGLVSLASLVTSYHTHRQTMVFLFVLFAALAGRALRPGVSLPMALVWLAPVIGYHFAADALRDAPYAYTFYPIQRYLTPPAILALVILAAALLVPWASRRLWWSGGDALAAGAGGVGRRKTGDGRRWTVDGR
ncbi:MAG: glycosyltransferase family 87 protein [Thermomicrobiales bacterium]